MFKNFKFSEVKVYEVDGTNNANQLVLKSKSEHDFMVETIKPHPKKFNLFALITSKGHVYVYDIKTKTTLQINLSQTSLVTSFNWFCNEVLNLDFSITYSDGSLEIFGKENLDFKKT